MCTRNRRDMSSLVSCRSKFGTRNGPQVFPRSRRCRCRKARRATQSADVDRSVEGRATLSSGPHLIAGAGLREIATPSSYFSGDGYSWASAGISSYNKVWLPATGGYVQIRAEMPDSTHGAWAGLWFLSQSRVGEEIDLQESGLNIPNEPNANYTFATDWHGTGGTQIKTNVGVDLSAACHVNGMEYNPGNWLKMYLDGRLMATYTTDIPTEPYEIVLDLDIAGPNASGFHSVADATNYPGPFELDVGEVQLYSLP